MAQRPKDEHKQVSAFRKAARELGCDENEGRFKEALRTIAKQKPRPAELKKRKRGP